MIERKEEIILFSINNYPSPKVQASPRKSQDHHQKFSQ